MRFLLLLGLYIQFCQAKPLLELLTPLDKSVTTETHLSVVARTDPKQVKQIEVHLLDTNITLRMDTDANRSSYCASVPFGLGSSTVRVTAYDAQHKPLIRQEASVFHASAVHKKLKYPPASHRQNVFHTAEREAACSPCHTMQNNETAGIAFSDITESNCYTCHKKITGAKYAHAPAVNWLCTSCHKTPSQMQDNEPGVSLYAFENPIAPTCFECHEKNIDKRYRHEPVELGRCNRCHNPHSSDHEYFLKKSVWDLCITCHADKVSGENHIVGVFQRRNHPTRGVPDPSRPGKELSCASCHIPHGGDVPFLLRSKNSNPYSLCSRCHKK